MWLSNIAIHYVAATAHWLHPLTLRLGDGESYSSLKRQPSPVGMERPPSRQYEESRSATAPCSPTSHLGPDPGEHSAHRRIRKLAGQALDRLNPTFCTLNALEGSPSVPGHNYIGGAVHVGLCVPRRPRCMTNCKAGFGISRRAGRSTINSIPCGTGNNLHLRQ